MSRAISRRAERTRDWRALLEAAQAEDNAARKLCPHGAWRDMSRGVDYVDALQQALEGRDPAPLLAMLDAGVPLSDALLPSLADVIRDAVQGHSTGRPRALTVTHDATIREHFDCLTGQDMKKTRAAAREDLARLFGVSVDSIKRSLKRSE